MEGRPKPTVAAGYPASRITEGERKLLEFAVWILDYWHEFDCNDIDGGDFQDYLDDHLLEKVKVEKPCHPELCKCDEFNDGDFPMECSRYPEDVFVAMNDHRGTK
jgi:hypothetical protein